MPSDPPNMPPLGVPVLSRADSHALARRRRGRNIAMLLGLVALVVLFYLITVVKMSQPHTTGGGGSSQTVAPAWRSTT